MLNFILHNSNLYIKKQYESLCLKQSGYRWAYLIDFLFLNDSLSQVNAYIHDTACKNSNNINFYNSYSYS